jgi:hypothetical protein
MGSADWSRRAARLGKKASAEAPAGSHTKRFPLEVVAALVVEGDVESLGLLILGDAEADDDIEEL